MTRRTIGLLVTLALAILVAPLAAAAQPRGHIPRVGVLSPATSEAISDLGLGLEAFRQGLRDLGYVEGQNILIDWRSDEGSDKRARDLAADLVRLKVDVLVAFGGPAARGAKKAASTIPIVMSVGDALEQGLVPSLARPGGNLTGISSMAVELSQQRLELLRELFPQLVRVAVLWCPDLAGNPLQWREIQAGAGRLSLQLQSLEVRRPDDIEPALEAAARDGTEALFVADCALLNPTHVQRIVTLAARHRLPAIYTSKSYVVAGGLMSYGSDINELFRRAATYVDKILKGAKPADLPVEQPTKFELVINLKTAQALGLTIPTTLLFQADEIIR
jgi:putative tryptophan/tyrosine transport system substrate-binding protein